MSRQGSGRCFNGVGNLTGKDNEKMRSLASLLEKMGFATKGQIAYANSLEYKDLVASIDDPDGVAPRAPEGEEAKGNLSSV